MNFKDKVVVLDFGNISSWKVANDYKIRYSQNTTTPPRSN